MPIIAFAAMALTALAAPQSPPLSTPPPPDRRPPPNPRPPRLIPRNYISDADYPVSARRAGIEGRVRVRLRVGAGGRVARCTIVQSSGSQALDVTSCLILRARARFLPATDRRGRRVAGVSTITMAWRLPPALIRQSAD